MDELVLLVDDNEGNRKLTRDVLEQAGIRTLSAASGAEGLALAAAHQPNLVLMDLRLPDIDGAEAARRLAADERTAGIPVVALSASSQPGTDDWLQINGFVGYLEKPIDVLAFPGQVRRYCARG